MPAFPRLGSLLATLLIGSLAVGSAGCASSGSYSLDEGALADRYLPSNRQVDYPPDSLRALRLRETDDQIKFDLNTSYQNMTARWSSTFRLAEARRGPTRPLTYATFWSLELSLASLQPEVGVGSLTKDKAREIIAQRRKEYEEVIQIDVYWFGPPSEAAVAGPGTQTRLRDANGNSYPPASSDFTPVREAFLTGGRTGTYRRNTFLFPRTDRKSVV